MASVIDLQRHIPRAKSACLRAARAVLPGARVLVALVDDAEIARVHKLSLGIEGPTDVITFPHGEIVVSAETAAREAKERSIPPLSELLLYVVHGALHLKGFDDAGAGDRERMRRAERRVLGSLGLGDVFRAHPR